MCFDICDKLGLVKSGGSDFHGGNKPDVELGKVSGGYVTYEFLMNMKEQAVMTLLKLRTRFSSEVKNLPIAIHIPFITVL